MTLPELPSAQFTTSLDGLSASEVAQRRADGLVNRQRTSAGRSTKQIIISNLATRINAILAVLFGCVLFTGSIVNGAFGLLIIANSAVGIIQELRAKRTLDSLSILAASPAVVVRDGEQVSVDQGEIVVDDLVVLRAGDQVVVDGVVLQANGLDVDESMLTGESVAVHKAVGETVWSGSYVSAGSGLFQARAVGEESYSSKLVAEAGAFSLTNSELRQGIDKILRVITWLLVPVGVLTVWVQLQETGVPLKRALLAMVAALVPMVPEGLVLMTSVAFAVGVIRLGKRKALVNELPAIEGLARVDVVCADKTGTLTENAMRLARVEDTSATGEQAPAWVVQALAAIAAADEAPNDTMRALAAAGDSEPDTSAVAVECVMPFDAARKYSAWQLSGAVEGLVVLGAPDVVLAKGPVADRAAEIAGEGLRVLALGAAERNAEGGVVVPLREPWGLAVVEQSVRPDAADTIEYFTREGMEVKIISGDNATSVGAVARQVGVEGPVVDARTLPSFEDSPEEFSRIVSAARVIGRVTPEQKRDIVRALDSAGHTVAMTGDGVNDVLALKEAAIGVAMGSGASATRSVAQLVLLDNRFATLPHVVAEGRRVIGNIERVANLFLTKTVYSIVLALVVGLFGVMFPFQPIHVTVAGWFTIGIPAFVLSLAPNAERARPGFASRVLRLALPSGLIIGLVTVAFWLVFRPGPDADAQVVAQTSTATFAVLIVMAVWVLGVVARPWSRWKVALLMGSVVFYVVIFVVDPVAELVRLDASDGPLMMLALWVGALGAVMIEGVWWLGRVSAVRQTARAASARLSKWSS